MTNPRSRKVIPFIAAVVLSLGAQLGLVRAGFAQTVEIVHDFKSPPTSPRGDLIQAADGFLYGTTQKGWASDQGMVFKMMPDGTSSSVIKSLIQVFPCHAERVRRQ